MRTVLILVGMPGSGKTTAANYFQRREIPVIRMGDVIDEELLKSNVGRNEKSEKFFRNKLRQKYGDDFIAKKIVPRVIEKLRKHSLVIIDGMRSYLEYKHLNDSFSCSIKIIYIESDKSIRYKRLTGRKLRSLSYKESKRRDLDEEKIGVLKLKKLADFVIKNQGTKLYFYSSLSRILSKFK